MLLEDRQHAWETNEAKAINVGQVDSGSWLELLLQLQGSEHPQSEVKGLFCPKRKSPARLFSSLVIFCAFLANDAYTSASAVSHEETTHDTTEFSNKGRLVRQSKILVR
jgi:hypothetical protein